MPDQLLRHVWHPVLLCCLRQRIRSLVCFSLYDRIVFIAARLYFVSRVLGSSPKGGYFPVLGPLAYLLFYEAFQYLNFIFVLR
jgi:hypothetical protein